MIAVPYYMFQKSMITILRHSMTFIVLPMALSHQSILWRSLKNMLLENARSPYFQDGVSRLSPAIMMEISQQNNTRICLRGCTMTLHIIPKYQKPEKTALNPLPLMKKAERRQIHYLDEDLILQTNPKYPQPSDTF